MTGDLSSLYVGDTVTLALGPATSLYAGSVGGVAPTNATHTTDPPTITYQVSASADDSFADGASDNAGGNVGLTYLRTERFTPDTSASKYNGGVRFQNVTLPQGATINAATLEVNVTNLTYDNPYLRCYGHLSTTSEDFVTDTTIRQRTPTGSSSALWCQTSAPVGWNNLTVTSAVQDVVNQAGWLSGNGRYRSS